MAIRTTMDGGAKIRFNHSCRECARNSCLRGDEVRHSAYEMAPKWDEVKERISIRHRSAFAKDPFYRPGVNDSLFTGKVRKFWIFIKKSRCRDRWITQWTCSRWATARNFNKKLKHLLLKPFHFRSGWAVLAGESWNYSNFPRSWEKRYLPSFPKIRIQIYPWL